MAQPNLVASASSLAALQKTASPQTAGTQNLQAMRTATAFPANTKPLALLSNLAPEQKQTPERMQDLSQKSNVVYLAFYKENPMTQMQALEDANAKGIILMPLKDLDERLNGEGELWKAEEALYPAWSGTFVAYEMPDKPLGKTIECKIKENTFVFNVPKKFQGKRNIALAINHGFSEDGKPLISYKQIGEKKFLVEIADKSMIKAIRHFPSEDGFYLPEKEFGLPSGSKLNNDGKNTRHLWRINCAYCGFASAGLGVVLIYGRRSVGVGGRSDGRFGVLAYAKQEPQEEIQK